MTTAVAYEVATGTLRGIDLHAGEHGGEPAGADAVLQRKSHSRPGFARRASADRVDHHEDRAVLCSEHFNIVGPQRFLEADLRELIRHG